MDVWKFASADYATPLTGSAWLQVFNFNISKVVSSAVSFSAAALVRRYFIFTCYVSLAIFFDFIDGRLEICQRGLCNTVNRECLVTGI